MGEIDTSTAAIEPSLKHDDYVTTEQLCFASERDALRAEMERLREALVPALAAELDALRAEVNRLREALVEAMIVPEAWMLSGFPRISDEAVMQIEASVAKARAALAASGTSNDQV